MRSIGQHELANFIELIKEARKTNAEIHVNDSGYWSSIDTICFVFLEMLNAMKEVKG